MEKKVDANTAIAVIGLVVIVLVLVFAAAIYSISGQQYVYNTPLHGSCFLMIFQNGENVAPDKLDEVSLVDRVYGFGINDNCQALYTACEHLYDARNFTCSLHYNICTCKDSVLTTG